MSDKVAELYADQVLVEKICRRLPHLFHYAERDSSRAGKVGMEVGSLRERILVSLLIHKFGRANVETNLPITQHEVDVRVCGESLSIKTITTKGQRVGAVKAIWTADNAKGWEFVRSYGPACPYLVAHIVWGLEGGLYYIPCAAQEGVLEAIGKDSYLQVPRPGTNERGVQISAKAMTLLIAHPQSLKIPILWQRPEDTYDQFARWVEYWRLD